MKYFLIAAALLAAFFFIDRNGERRGEAVVQAKWDIQKGKDDQLLKDATDRANGAEAKMNNRVREIQDDTERQIKAINDKHAAALVELQRRAERRANATASGAGTTGQCAGASGAELSRSDAEFLAGEAARADQVVIELNACNAKYDSVAATINMLRPTDSAAGVTPQ